MNGDIVVTSPENEQVDDAGLNRPEDFPENNLQFHGPLHPFEHFDDIPEDIFFDSDDAEDASEDGGTVSGGNSGPFSSSTSSFTSLSFTSTEGNISTGTTNYSGSDLGVNAVDTPAVAIPTDVIILSDDSIDDDEMYKNPALLRIARQLPVEQGDEGVRRCECDAVDAVDNVAVKDCNVDFLIGSGRPLYTPLQKWEYTHGLPIAGIADVEKWASEVGLKEHDIEENRPCKKLKTSGDVQLPKYGDASRETYDALIADINASVTAAEEKVNDQPTTSCSVKEKGKEEDTVDESVVVTGNELDDKYKISVKGKEKEDNLV